MLYFESDIFLYHVFDGTLENLPEWVNDLIKEESITVMKYDTVNGKEIRLSIFSDGIYLARKGDIICKYNSKDDNVYVKVITKPKENFKYISNFSLGEIPKEAFEMEEVVEKFYEDLFFYEKPKVKLNKDMIRTYINHKKELFGFLSDDEKEFIKKDLGVEIV